ncbi:MAG TPA: M17 family peptidase N-terminal domain-containing protein, partial [Candidatus Angelobacter sp.]|nr:M17 family peptidase N-terminal domain-containing protein [Candidatus Angelobacter sp.]
MRSELTLSKLPEIQTELLAVLVADAQTSKGPEAKPELALLTSDPTVRAAAEAVLASGEYKAAANETLLLFAPAGLAAKRLLLVGLGKLPKATIHNVRNAAGTAVRFAKPRGIRQVA